MKFYTLIILLSLASLTIQAREVAGINISETAAFTDQSTKLKLNGAGIRTKFIFDIYIGSLYLETRSNNTKDILKLHGEKRISMHFLYDEVSKEKLVNGWNEGFENNLSEKEFKVFQPQIIKFNTLFETVKSGDVIDLHFIPTTGTHVIINGNNKGLIESDPFFNALLKIWLGDKPADSDLKVAMLGLTKD
ncbi:MAG: chalcone isomerase family protein [Woeseiaceae bacterium]